MPVLFYLVISQHFNKYKFKNWLMIIYLSLFIFINTGQLVYQYNTDKIINIFKNYVIVNNLESKTHPGQFYHSIGYLFKDYMINIILKKNNKHMKIIVFKLPNVNLENLF